MEDQVKEVNVADETQVTDNVTNSKPWFNGVHTFPSVKVNPPQQPPPSLSINVSETIKITDKVGG